MNLYPSKEQLKEKKKKIRKKRQAEDWEAKSKDEIGRSLEFAEIACKQIWDRIT